MSTWCENKTTTTKRQSSQHRIPVESELQSFSNDLQSMYIKLPTTFERELKINYPNNYSIMSEDMTVLTWTE